VRRSEKDMFRSIIMVVCTTIRSKVVEFLRETFFLLYSDDCTLEVGKTTEKRGGNRPKKLYNT
jgi:hypothetical protein